jgi:hypothetical protein
LLLLDTATCKEKILLVLGACTLAFLLPSVFFLKDIEVFAQYFTVSWNDKQLGPGLALLTSALMAWLVLTKVKTVSGRKS